ncbi:MAG: trehalose-6-phosphate synthase [Actinomycetota bacterium]|nr:trehalose-6-phosphate synthase [Actinomycetota bacterium]
MPASGTTSLAVLSNRGPVSFVHDQDGNLVPKRASGGMVAVLGPGVVEHDALWLATALSDADRAATATGEVLAEGYRMRSLTIDPSQFRQYYNVIANQTLWFLVHGLWDLPRRPRFDRHWHQAWTSFVAVNRQFAEAAAAELAPGATVLIHDYQLSLVGAELRRLRPDVRSSAFIHTPFCRPSELDVLPTPVADTLIAGLGGAGACGFHSQRWADAFGECCRERRVAPPEVFVSPAAVDAVGLAQVAGSAECEAELRGLDQLIGGRRFIVRADRIELSKNVLRGFHAFDDLLTAEPAWRGRVIFGAFVYPSRENLAEYLGYRHEVEAVVRAVNAKWSTSDWTPIVLDLADNYARSVAALRRYDVLMVNPIRDGLNLVAKEGPIVNERNGVLLLSPGAGVWDELSSHAVEVHPFDVSGTADALALALTMPADERATRAHALKKVATARTPLDWFAEQVAQARPPAP